jgi:hypothetical protein
VKLPPLRITIPITTIWRAFQTWRKQRAHRRFQQQRKKMLSREENR